MNNPRDIDASAQTDAQVRRVILIEGAANLVILLSKVVIGLSTGSMGILAEAVHSLADISNNVVAWIVMNVSTKPADREHPYGHRKFETLAVFILASLLVVLAFKLALDAFQREMTEVTSSALELGVMIGVLMINIGVTRWQHGWARRLNSDLLHADATHTFADVLATGVVIIGWQLSAAGYPLIDRLCALAVVVVILYLAYTLFKRTLPILLDEIAIPPEKISHVIRTVDGVKNVYRIRSRWIGKNRAIDLVIAVEPGLPIEQAHDITDRIEALLEQHFQVTDISIHVEPDAHSEDNGND